MKHEQCFKQQKVEHTRDEKEFLKPNDSTIRRGRLLSPIPQIKLLSGCVQLEVQYQQKVTLFFSFILCYFYNDFLCLIYYK